MNKESYDYLKEKIRTYEGIKSVVIKHEAFLARYEKCPEQLLSVGVDFSSILLDVHENFKEKLIELVKEQLKMYQQILNEL